ncbi:MAG: hypothetical protein WCJ07_06700 [Verrucomicrobiota bacterium]
MISTELPRISSSRLSPKTTSPSPPTLATGAHSDAIITTDAKSAKKFLAQVDSATVYVNASTRFTDGGEFGMGAEIGISTDKIGARGPMGLDELTSYKWLGLGTGQIRS